MALIWTTRDGIDGPFVEMKIVDLQGKRVKAAKSMRNSTVIVPRGAKGTVSTATPRWGLTIHFDPCKHCGVKAVMSKVRVDDVLLLEEDDG